MFVLMFSTFVLSAPSVVVTDLSSQTSGNTIALTFTITGEDGDANYPDDLVIAYSQTAGGFENSIYTDTNLLDATGVTCDDYNFFTASTCTYNWLVPAITPMSYYIDANYVQPLTGLGYTDSSTAFIIENTQNCATMNFAVLLIALGICSFTLLKFLNDTNPTTMVMFAVSVMVGIAIIYFFTSSVCVVT